MNDIWGSIPLNDLLLLCDSGTWGDPSDPKEGIAVLRSTNINKWTLDLTGDIAYRNVSARDLQNKRLQDGDIIVTKSSGSPQLIGEAALFDINDDLVFLFSNFLQRLRPDSKKVLPKYLHYYLSSPMGREVLNQMHRTTSGLRNLIFSRYLEQNVPIPNPENPEKSILMQQRVIHRLEQYLDEQKLARRLHEKIVADTNRLMDAVLAEVFPCSEEMHSEGWNLLTLSEVCLINPTRPRNLPYSDGVDTSFVPMAAVDEREGKISDLQIRPFGEIKRGYTYFEENDVLFAKITPCMENGKAAIAHGLIHGFGFGSTEFHVLRPNTGILPEWIYYFLRRETFRQEAKTKFRGAVGQQRVPQDFLQTHLIPVPYPENPEKSLNIQRQIVTRIQTTADEVAEAQLGNMKTGNLLNQMEQSILAQAFRGEL